MKTHLVIDQTATVEEGQESFAGTYQQCLDFITEQGSFGYKIVPMTKQELEIHNT
jgi:hypothetical protein